VKVWSCEQQAGSSKSVSPLPSSSMQLPQISRGGGSVVLVGVGCSPGRVVVVVVDDVVGRAVVDVVVGSVVVDAVEVLVVVDSRVVVVDAVMEVVLVVVVVGASVVVLVVGASVVVVVGGRSVVVVVEGASVVVVVVVVGGFVVEVVEGLSHPCFRMKTLEDGSRTLLLIARLQTCAAQLTYWP